MNNLRIDSLVSLYDLLPEEERMIVDLLRKLIIENLPNNCKEKISFNVPFFYGRKGICIIWPSAIPNGGIKKGVLLGFWQGNKLNDIENYLKHGTNKKVFYKIFYKVEEIDQTAIVKLLKEAVRIDSQFKS